MKKPAIWLMSSLLLCLVSSISIALAESAPGPMKKVLYVNSYHTGYEWSDEIRKSIEEVMKGKNIELREIEMDTKRHTSEEFKQQAALKAKQVIEEFQPDVVIASDDAASKYLIQPYYKGSTVPFVFCGVNWDASIYGYPYDNVTGMVELALTLPLINQMKKYAKGERVGLISVDQLTEQKGLPYYEKIFRLKFDKIYMVSTFDEWKQKFRQMQGEVDMIFFVNSAGIKDWDDAAAEQFVLDNIRIPVGTNNVWMMRYALLGIAKLPSEQGHWAAHAALKILDGVSPSQIPLTRNKKGVSFFNRKIAARLGITQEPPFATIVE